MTELWITLEGHRPHLLAHRPDASYPWLPVDIVGENLLALFRTLGWPGPTDPKIPSFVLRDREQS